MKNLETLKFHVNANIEWAEKNIAKWKVNFEKDPSYALEWSENTFTDAALLRVSKLIMTVIEKGENAGVSENDILDDVFKMSMSRVVAHGRYPSKSTSVPHNVMDREYLSAWTKYLELFEDRI